MDDLFWDDSNGGYFSAADTGDAVLLRVKDDNDNSEPSPNSTAALNLIRLSHITGEVALRKRVRSILKNFAWHTANSASSLPGLALAADATQAPSSHVLVAAPERNEAVIDAVRALQRHGALQAVPVVVMLAVAGDEELAAVAPSVAGMGPLDRDGGPVTTFYVCANGLCRAPTTDLDEAIAQLSP